MLKQRLKNLAPAAILFAVNAYAVAPLFRTEYIAQMGSIEAAFISIARYAMDNGSDLTWFPLWYGGIPYQNTYPPLLHLIVAAVAKLFGLSPALSYHAVTAAFYCLGPVTLYWLARRLSGSTAAAFAAGLFYSVVSPAVLLIGSLRAELGLFNPRRLQTLLLFGEGPHLAAMTLLPLAVLCLHNALEDRRWWRYLLCALSMAAVALTNWLGAFALAAAVLACLLSRPQPMRWQRWAIAAGIGLYAYLLASPWIPPSTLAAIRTNGQRIGGNFALTGQHLKYAGLLLVALVFLDYCFSRWKPPLHLRFALVFFLLLAAIVLGWYWFHISLMPQPDRYTLELEMALVLAGVFLLHPLVVGMGRARCAAIVCALLVFAFLQLKVYRGFVKSEGRPIGIRSTVEYRAARWFDRNMSGARVFASGSVGFWLNTFTDTPQINGGFDQGITNQLQPHFAYQIYSGEGASGREGEIAALWLKAMGAHAIFVGGPNGREAFKDFRQPRKFDGLFRELWREGDDVIYEVPARSLSLAHVMRAADLAPRTPTGGTDVDPLRPYVAALDNPAYPPASFAWRNRHAATVSADLRDGDLVALQVTYHPGWHATVNGRSCRTFRDRLNQLVVDPESAGPCTIELNYDGGLEMLLCRLLSWLALAAAVAFPCLRWATMVVAQWPRAAKH